MANLKPATTTAHDLGGAIRWYALPNGKSASILGGEDTAGGTYPHADDFEIHERDTDGQVIPGTEQRASTLEAAEAIVEKIGR